MPHSYVVNIVALAVTGVIIVLTAALDLVIACEISPIAELSAIKHTLVAAFALQLIALSNYAYQCVTITNLWPATRAEHIWLMLSFGTGFTVIALATNGVALILLFAQDISKHSHVSILAYIAIILWVLGILFQVATSWLSMSSILRRLSARTPDVQQPSRASTITRAKEIANATRRSCCSKSTTLVSRPESPESTRIQSRQSSTSKFAGITSSFLKLRPGGSVEKAEDLEISDISKQPVVVEKEDFSQQEPLRDSSDRMIRLNTPSPVMLRAPSSLATIPGSRPVSSEGIQATAFPALGQRRAHGTDKSEDGDFPASSSDSFRQGPSRPHSGLSHSTRTRSRSRVSASPSDLIHPLFRPDSLTPPQILTSKTMVTASPLADQVLTPRSLARLRSDSDLQREKRQSHDTMPGSLVLNARGKWDVTPSSTRSSVRGRVSSVASAGSANTGTTSRANERGLYPAQKDLDGGDLLDLPILPGFVLSAGTRSSLIDYGKRRSVKTGEAPAS